MITEVAADNKYNLTCRLPDFHAPIHPSMTRRKFSIYSSPVSGGAGLGNILTYWSVAWVLAAISGQDIVIVDNSMLGKMCLIIKCGFVMKSEVMLNDSYSYINENPDIIKIGQVLEVINGKRVVGDVSFVSGFLSHHSAWVFPSHVQECLSPLTGCPVNDTLCFEHFAYSSLVKGPFTTHAIKSLQDRVVGMPPHLMNLILNEPFSMLPRIDGAFQLRMQYAYMEQSVHVRNPDLNFLNTTEGMRVLKISVAELERYLYDPQSPFNLRPMKRHPIIYLSCDDSEDKILFAQELSKIAVFRRGDHTSPVSLVYTRNLVNISHTKGFSNMNNEEFENSTEFSNMVDTVFDWYMLADSNIMWSYRNSKVVSTFVESAGKLSDRDVCDYSKFGKVNYLHPGLQSFARQWVLEHPTPDKVLAPEKVTCQAPHISAHQFRHNSPS
jgi:hypothetical protein